MMLEGFLSHLPTRLPILSTKHTILGRAMLATSLRLCLYLRRLRANIRCRRLIYHTVIHLVQGLASQDLADKSQVSIVVIVQSFRQRLTVAPEPLEIPGIMA